MIIQCDRCQATYDLPAARVPPQGMKAKCAACGNVIKVGAAAKAKNLPPTKSQPPIDAPPPPRSQPPIDAAPVQRRKPGNQPSVIIDMGQLNEPAPDDGAAQVAAQQAAFAPLAADSSSDKPEPERHRVRQLPSLNGMDPGEIREIKPPSAAKVGALLFLVVLVGLGLFVAWKNDFGPTTWQAPMRAVRIAFGFEKPEVAPAPVAPAPVRRMQGELTIEAPMLTWLTQRNRRKVAVVRATMNNGTDRTLHAIRLEVRLREVGLDLHTRKFDCCEDFDDAQAIEVANNPDHPHFDEHAGVRDVVLAPGQAQNFAVLFRDLDPDLARRDLEPELAITFYEPVKQKQ
ncbi:MAG: zinc-ribbon domain-containing protein [Myxococcales bacterium]|nr:zinc-ribbon domain-containing protein [Myxococcales bacterium]